MEIPNTLEITFAKNPKVIGDFKMLPHILDNLTGQKVQR